MILSPPSVPSSIPTSSPTATRVEFGFSEVVLFIVFAVSVGAFAVWSGYRKHNSLLPAILFLTGLSMVVVSHFILGHSHLGAPAQARDWVDMGSDALAVVGGLTLVAFHFVNARKIKHAGCQCPTCRTERVSE